MAMDAHVIEEMIKESLPDARVIIEDLRGDGDHYAALVVSEAFRVRAGCSSTRWSMPPCAERWAANCMPWPSRPPFRKTPRNTDIRARLGARPPPPNQPARASAVFSAARRSFLRFQKALDESSNTQRISVLLIANNTPIDLSFLGINSKMYRGAQ